MKPIQVLSALGLAVALAAGCQEMTSTTSTGPSEGNGEATVKKLTVTAASRETIRQGGTDNLTIKIARENFNSPVTIRVSDLPKGVEPAAKEVVIPAGETSAKVRLTAANDATVGEHIMEIDADAPGLKENVHTLKLVVMDRNAGYGEPSVPY